MVEMKKELTIFLVFAAFLGWEASSLISESSSSMRTRNRGVAKEYASQAIPDVLAGLRDEDRTSNLDRDLFAPPSDTAPLPLLDLDLPPMEPLALLGVPTAFGPDAKHMSDFLLTEPTTHAAPGLFDQQINTVETVADVELPPAPDSELSAEERMARITARKKLYDWMVTAEMKFGLIQNRDRTLLTRNNEPILFLEVHPDTGQPLYAGQGPIPYARDRVQDFGLADTPSNRIELGRAEFGDALAPGDFEGAMRFAHECVALRNEAPQALTVAEEMYQDCSQLQTSAVLPRLGLARCYELGFRFEKAFQVYKDLTEGELRTEPEPWARLGDLYARFRMFGPARAAFEEGLRRSRSNWVVRWLYGRYLLGRGEFTAALEHLNRAQQNEPGAPELRSARVGIRADLGHALTALGRLDEAEKLFERALSADPDDDLGLAGLYSIAVLRNSEDLDPALAQQQPDASFELLLATGLQAIQDEQWQEAYRNLQLAKAADPFRAWLPMRSLSWLAEITMHPEEARSMIEAAYQANPLDEWTLYQRGRLRALSDDVAGALECFQDALDRELDFADALIAMSVLSRQTGENEAAELYFERALAIDPDRPRVHSRRGFNFLELEELSRAEDSFKAALELDPNLASALCGVAWTFYAKGQSSEAQSRYAELTDLRRNLPEGDLVTAFAEGQSERIRDHESKESWRDRFDRIGRVGNGWSYDQGYGAEVRLRDGEVWIEGQLTRESRTRLLRELPADRFLSIEATVTLHPEARDVSVGMFVSRETESRAGSIRTHASVELVRNWDGVLRAKLIKKGELEALSQDLYTSNWAVGEPMRLRIEKAGEKSSDTTVTLWFDDTPVLENISIPTLGRSSQPVRFGVYVEGRGGRTSAVSIDDVRVVRRRL